ncbi:hypothetical protein V6Z11_A06G095000 [Gossypium hirsutum]
MWTYKICNTIPEAFNQELMIPKAKMWMKFVCSRILLTTEMSEVGPAHAIKTYGILQKKQICISKWINHSTAECAITLGRGIFFPHLITGLCKKTGVQIERMDKTMNLP